MAASIRDFAFYRINIAFCNILDCTASWTKKANTYVPYSKSSDATTLADCKANCFKNGKCTGVDWHQGHSGGKYCWLSGPWSGRQNSNLELHTLFSPEPAAQIKLTAYSKLYSKPYFCLSNAMHSIGQSIKLPECPCLRASNIS